MKELAGIITCVTGDVRQRRTIYEADQDFERFGKTLNANFKDTETLWAFLRASLRQCHIHKLSKVGKDRAAWAKADEYPANLMDSDTILTLEDTNDAIKRAGNHPQRQDIEGDKRTAFSSAFDEEDTEHEVKALRAALKESEKRLEETDQCLSALEAKFDSFSHTSHVRTTSGRSRRGRNATTARKLANGRKVMMNLYACTSKETTQMQSFRPSRKDVQGRVAGQP